MDEWDEIILNRIWDKIVNIFKKEKKQKQYKLRIKRHIVSYDAHGGYCWKVQRKFLNIFWITVYSGMYDVIDAQSYIKNYCEILARKQKKKLDRKKIEKPVIVKCDCD